MRLIDADRLKEILKDLSNMKKRYFLTIANTGNVENNCVYLKIANVIDKAIEIVKGGVLNGEIN